MIPKEKAIQLYDKYASKWHHTPADVKYYCTLAVDEIINAFKDAEGDCTMVHIVHYWQDVKIEIERL